MYDARRQEPQGAFRSANGEVTWRVWAPFSPSVTLVTWPETGQTETDMNAVGDGCFACRLSQVPEGLRYAYRLADGHEYPDPASRWQLEGVHRPSAVFFPDAFAWSDEAWHGIARQDLAIYELHVGTFTPEGTLAAIIPRLSGLRDLGVTALEIMPVAQFPGQRNWGYDGVHPGAVQNSYGGPQGLQALVNAAHEADLAVILDVVYNHLGNEGNYLGKFGPYFTHRYQTPWGQAVNFDGPDGEPVRRFFVDNARQWVRDFHVDGLRLDAVQTIFDHGAHHILAEIQEAVQEEARAAGRIVQLIAESDQNDVRIIDPPDRGGYGLDAVWSDDFHHSVHALLTGQRDGYYEDFGEPWQVAKAFESVFVYDGCYSVHRRRRHGSRVEHRDRSQFVVCIQNHDQVGNRAAGDRLGSLVTTPAQRLACGLLLLSPCIPLLWMGEEYGETRPFPFFCSFGDPQLVEAVRRGRRAEFADLAFQWGGDIPDPQSPETFASAGLSWSWPDGSPQAGIRNLYRDLLAARRRWPPLRGRSPAVARLVPVQDFHGDERVLLALQRGSDGELLACANLTPLELPLAVDVGGRRRLLSTEDQRYGGGRTGEAGLRRVGPYELVIFGQAEWH
ncbi:MAG: malto-oligosyltrehalose trehalohydrolase [Pirellulaceae bacterium]|nr:malto-oligosyltrehalose trehalohydrolase [Pirellulaceae bacterium]